MNISLDMSAVGTADDSNYALAQSILGPDFITPEEIFLARPKIYYSDDKIAKLIATLPLHKTLQMLKSNDCVLLPTPHIPMSISDIRHLQHAHFYTGTGFFLHDECLEYVREKENTAFGWLAIRKSKVSGSARKSWAEQHKLISSLEYVPNIAEMGWFVTTYNEVRHEWLFKDTNVRTSSLDSRGARLSIGCFGGIALSINTLEDYLRDSSLGVASAIRI